jgi:hypothetical protein
MKKITLLAVAFTLFSTTNSFGQNWTDVTQNFFNTVGSAAGYQYDPATGTWNAALFLANDVLGQYSDAATQSDVLGALAALRGAWADSSAIALEVQSLRPNAINPVTVLSLQPGTPDFAATNDLRSQAYATLNINPNNPAQSIWNAVRTATPAKLTLGTIVQTPLDAGYFGQGFGGSAGLFVTANPDPGRSFSLGYSGSLYAQYQAPTSTPALGLTESVEPSAASLPAGVNLFSAHGYFGAYTGFTVPGTNRFLRGYIGGGAIGGVYFPAHVTAANPNNVGRTTGTGGFAEAGLQTVMGNGLLRSGFRIGLGSVSNSGYTYEVRDMFLMYTRRRLEISSHATVEKWGPYKGGLFLRTGIGYIIDSPAIMRGN